MKHICFQWYCTLLPMKLKFASLNKIHMFILVGRSFHEVKLKYNRSIYGKETICNVLRKDATMKHSNASLYRKLVSAL
jgi:hypothetical protein